MSAWTDEAGQMLESLWKEGLSASQISERLYLRLGLRFSRNAVIGKVHRMGLQGRLSPAVYTGPRDPVTGAPLSRMAFQARPRKRVVAKPAGADRPPTPQRAPVREDGPAPDTAKPFAERRRGECGWIFGDPLSGGVACCAPTLPGSPWCAAHRERANQPGSATARVDERIIRRFG